MCVSWCPAKRPVPALADLQAAIRDALLGGDPFAAASYVAGDGLEPEARLRIYQHHVTTTLTAALESTFPVVRRLVDARFFAYAADSYIREHPPSQPCLAEYGASLPAFLAEFPPCQTHAYLPDVARLEWAIHVARQADEAGPLDVTRLSSMPAETMPHLVFRFHPSVSFVASAWPIDRIWRANQEDASADGVVDLDGGVCLEVRMESGDVVLRALSAPRHAFRRALVDGSVLEHAAETALAMDPSFDLTLEIHQLFRDGLPIDFTIARP
jgi:hypothetical protein